MDTSQIHDHWATVGTPIIHLYDWVIFHCVYGPHLLYLLHCRWTFRCLHGLGIVPSTSMNIGVQVSFQVMFSLERCPGVGLLDQG